MLNTLNKMVLGVLVIFVVWLVATIGFTIFRVIMTLIIGPTNCRCIGGLRSPNI